MKYLIISVCLLFLPLVSDAQTGICFLDGKTYTTLAQAISCAGSSGTIEVTPSAKVVSVPSSTTVPAGVTLQSDRGAILAVGTALTLTISGPLVDGLYQMFEGAGTVSFTLPGNQAVSRPEWLGGIGDGTLGSGAGTGTAH